MSNIELTPVMETMLENILRVADISTDDITYSRQDIVAIALNMYFLASMTELMFEPGVALYIASKANWQENRNK